MLRFVRSAPWSDPALGGQESPQTRTSTIAIAANLYSHPTHANENPSAAILALPWSLKRQPATMLNSLRATLLGLVGLAAVPNGGCSGGPMPSLPELTGSLSESSIVGTPTEVYERIARGAIACWFGTGGPLKREYVYDAEAAPPSQGGRAEISIHERNRKYDTPKGPRAFRITIAPEKEQTTLAFENVTLADPLALSLEADARRWGAGAIGCTATATNGWSESATEPSSPPAEGKKKPAPKSH